MKKFLVNPTDVYNAYKLAQDLFLKEYEHLLEIAKSVDQKEVGDYKVFNAACDEYDKAYKVYRKENHEYAEVMERWLNHRSFFRGPGPKPTIKKPIEPVFPIVPKCVWYISYYQDSFYRGEIKTSWKYKFSSSGAVKYINDFKEEIETKVNVSGFALEPFTMTAYEINRMVHLSNGVALNKLKEELVGRLSKPE